MTNLIYEASVYSREVSYRNFKGEEKQQRLDFALDPLQLMTVIAGFEPKKVKSGNPALQNQTAPVSDEQQLKFVRNLAVQAAGSASVDGESWIPFPEFEDSLAGKAFLTQLASSDGDRREFSEKVILAPFRAFTEFAAADPSNTAKDVQQLQKMLGQIESIFTLPDPSAENLDDRRARLAAELALLSEDPQDTPPSAGPIPLP